MMENLTIIVLCLGIVVLSLMLILLVIGTVQFAYGAYKYWKGD